MANEMTDPIATLRQLVSDFGGNVHELTEATVELERRERLICAFEASLREEGLLEPGVRFLDKYEAEQFPGQKPATAAPDMSHVSEDYINRKYRGTGGR